MPKLHFVLPQLKHKHDCQAFLEEARTHKSELQGVAQLDHYPYETWLTHVYNQHFGTDLQENYVQATTFLVYDDARLIGFINIRHCLNPFLRRIGGHIGYMVRPLERQKGYATKMLSQALEYCKIPLNLTAVLVTCNDTNEASKRTILANGGIYEGTDKDETHGTIERYWITIQ